MMTRDEVLSVARAGAKAGCTEALFTLGDKPELRYNVVRSELEALGHATTLSYLAEMCKAVLDETGLLPHINAGVMEPTDIASLRRVSVSQGLMLETISERLAERGGPHFGSPDKLPAKRLETIASAGALNVPFTSGILIGIGETRAERLESLFALRQLHERFCNIQEVIIQNFRAKPGTKMATHPEPDQEDLLWTIAAARLIFGGEMNLQAPPNLSGNYGQLIAAGINDWGGISPVTHDHVNPEAPWPEITDLAARTAEHGKELVPRLPLYPSYVLNSDRWIDDGLRPRILRSMDSDGFARLDHWSPGRSFVPEIVTSLSRRLERRTIDLVAGAEAREQLKETDIAYLFSARGAEFDYVCEAANRLREKTNGNEVTYIVNRNINYTNICTHGCKFCAFSKGKRHENLRGPAYRIDAAEVARRAREAWDRGATEVCMQGGIHPEYTGSTYLDLLRAVKEATPNMHIHAFSPLEVTQGAATLRVSIESYLRTLKDSGLGSIPGTAAEILDDEVRRKICPDKLTTNQWIDVVRTAHALGMQTTATIMFGHVDQPIHWARHLLKLRNLQLETRGFTEFVPLPFVHMEAPMYLRGHARRGPTLRETILMHSVARLVLHGAIDNIQTSWVKIGPGVALQCLNAGANDLGGTLMNESISRAAGTEHGQEFPPAAMESLIFSARRFPRQRSTLYGDVPNERRYASFSAAPLASPKPVASVSALLQ